MVMMKVILFGVGTYYEKLKICFQHDEIIALIDNNHNKIGTIRDGIKVSSPKLWAHLCFDRIFILTSKVDTIYNQLLELGIPKDKISTLYDLPQFYAEAFMKSEMMLYYPKDRLKLLLHSTKKRVAILTQGMGINGGDFVIGLLTEVLASDCEVHVISWTDGPLRQKIMSLGAVVMIDNFLMTTTLQKTEWAEAYDLIIVNGAGFYGLFAGDNFSVSVPVIWWIHSSGTMNSEIMLQTLEGHSEQGRVLVYGVSNRAVASFGELLPSWQIEELCYGIHDFRCRKSNRSEKIIFAIIGSLHPRKGQDILLDAFEHLEVRYRDLCELWIIGPAKENDYTRKIQAQAKKYSNVKIMGVFDNEKLQDIYDQISVLVCPSREDTMPIVCAEAMMHYRPCIVSENVGTAQYIEHAYNGLIVKTGNVNDLREKIEWVIDNKKEIEKMGINARKIYETRFLFEIFEHNLMKMTKTLL